MKDKTVVLPEWYFKDLMEGMKGLAAQINKLTLSQEPIAGYAAEEDMVRRLKEAELKIEDLIYNKGLWSSPEERIAAIEQTYKELTHSLKHELDAIKQDIAALKRPKEEEVSTEDFLDLFQDLLFGTEEDDEG